MASVVCSVASHYLPLLAKPRIPATSLVSPNHSLLLQPQPQFFSLSQQSAAPNRYSSFQVRASSSSEESSPDEILEDLKKKWDAIEDKTTVLLYGGGAIVVVWLTSIVVGAINSIPLLPKILELVGLGYSGWFVYRYLLFKQSRQELANEIDALKKKIAGTED